MKPESRLEGWQVVMAAIVGVATIAVISSHHLGVLVWTLTQVAAGAVAGYWIDRTVFHADRPGDMSESVEARHARYRRAVIIAAGVIGTTVGV